MTYTIPLFAITHTLTAIYHLKMIYIPPPKMPDGAGVHH